MVQTGVPFGEVTAVRDWLGIREPVESPAAEHPKRPVLGFACTRSEVSGRRLWGLFRERFGTAEAFFAEHFVLNYCPLAFLSDSGGNITPDKLRKSERESLFAVCDTLLAQSIEALRPAYAVGIGKFAERRLHALTFTTESIPRVTGILHPSPASPAANRGWAERAAEALTSHGVWDATATGA
jgi:single-strand selective monofunctional uracil DNA glycosylase